MAACFALTQPPPAALGKMAAALAVAAPEAADGLSQNARVTATPAAATLVPALISAEGEWRCIKLVVAIGLIADLLLDAWWVDDVTSLAVVWFVVKEGREAGTGEECCDE